MHFTVDKLNVIIYIILVIYINIPWFLENITLFWYTFLTNFKLRNWGIKLLFAVFMHIWNMPKNYLDYTNLILRIVFSKFDSDCGWIRPKPSRPSMLNVTGSGVCRDEQNSILVSIHTGIRIRVFEIKRKLITVCMHSLVCHATLGWAWQLTVQSSRYDTYNKSRTNCAGIRCIIIPNVI